MRYFGNGIDAAMATVVTVGAAVDLQGEGQGQRRVLQLIDEHWVKQAE